MWVGQNTQESAYIYFVVEVGAIYVAVHAMRKYDQRDCVITVPVRFAFGFQPLYFFSNFHFRQITLDVHVELELFEQMSQARFVYVGPIATQFWKFDHVVIVEVLVDDEHDEMHDVLHKVIVFDLVFLDCFHVTL